MAGVLVVAGVFSGSLLPGHAHAQLSACRSDPVLVISNVGLMDLQAGISDSMPNVQQVAYVVHGPPGTNLLATINTDTLIGLKETVRYYDDDKANTFDVYTTVYTAHGPVAVSASSTVLSPFNLVLGLGSTNGRSDVPIRTHYSTLLGGLL